MAVDKSYARLGVFVVLSVLVIIATSAFFLHRAREHEAIKAVTYTDGNASGLQVSSQVRYRGVEIGRVSDLRVEARGSLIEIDLDVYEDWLKGMGADVERVKKEA